MNQLILVVGVGNVTATVVDAETNVELARTEHIAFDSDTPMAHAVDLPASRLWEAAARAARRAVWRSGVAGSPGGDISAVALAAFVPGLVLLGKNDRPLAPIWLPNDRRARRAMRQVQAHVGAEYQAAFGRHAVPESASALHWRQQLSSDPYLSHRVKSYLHVAGWLAFHLTGEKAFDVANASATGLCLPAANDWSSRWCSYFEVQRDWLPRILSHGHAEPWPWHPTPGSSIDGALGTVRAAVAAETGVPAGIPVVFSP